MAGRGRIRAADIALVRERSKIEDIVGEHLVQFTGTGERVELVHRAMNRDVFARGALHAASRLRGRQPGAWRLRDLL